MKDDSVLKEGPISHLKDQYFASTEELPARLCLNMIRKLKSELDYDINENVGRL